MAQIPALYAQPFSVNTFINSRVTILLYVCRDLTRKLEEMTLLKCDLSETFFFKLQFLIEAVIKQIIMASFH